MAIETSSIPINSLSTRPPHMWSNEPLQTLVVLTNILYVDLYWRHLRRKSVCVYVYNIYI